MQIDIVSDTVCPWCFIGKRRLERALALRPDMEFDIRWRAYRLDPTIPPEGVDRKQYMQAKFGNNPNRQAMQDKIAHTVVIDERSRRAGAPHAALPLEAAHEESA